MKLLSLFLTAFFVIGCYSQFDNSGNDSNYVRYFDYKEDTTFAIPELTNEIIGDSKNQIKIGDNTLALKANVWRDFMPTIGERRREVICSMAIYETSGKEILFHYYPRYMYLFSETKQYKSYLRVTISGSTKSEIFSKNYGKGPIQFFPNDKISAIVEFQDSTGKKYYLKNDNIKLGATF